MEKYGFIYLWRDQKYNRYYIGSHWGTENDGYICSSDAMGHAHKRRPQDFKRRIVKKVYSNRNDLIEEEQRWLDMIKPAEFGVKYYNINNKAFCRSWWVNDETRKQVAEKLKGNKNGATPCPPDKAKKISEAKRKKFQAKRDAGLPMYDEKAHNNIKAGSQVNRKPHTQEWKEANGKMMKERWAKWREENPKAPKMTREEQDVLCSQQLKSRWADPVWRANQIEKLKGAASKRLFFYLLTSR